MSRARPPYKARGYNILDKDGAVAFIIQPVLGAQGRAAAIAKQAAASLNAELDRTPCAKPCGSMGCEIGCARTRK